MNDVNDIPKGWVETTLGSLVKVGRGSSPRPIHNYISDKGIPWVKIADASASNNKYIEETKQFIIEEGRSTSVKPGDLIVSNSATPGIPKIMAIDACVHDGWLVFDEYKNIDKLYLYYFFLFFRRKLNHSASGSVFKNLKTDIVRNIQIQLPKNIEEQKAIANILTAFDDKIENLQAQNKTLEQTAQTIFKEWFGKYQVGDELPEGWRVGRIGDYITDSIGGDYGKEEPQDDYEIETICLRGTDLPDMKMGVPEKAPVRFLKKSKIDKCKLLNGDIVIEISGGTENQSTGRVAYINEQILNQSNLLMTCVNFCRILRPKNPENSYFIYSLFEYLYDRRVLFNWENGTTGIKNLSLNALLNVFELVLPDNDDLIKKFNSITKSLFEKIQKNNIQIQTLKKTRDTFLPKLMSGQIRVKL